MNAESIMQAGELALAAYANLLPGTMNQVAKDSLKDARMSAPQADNFASRYSVVAQFNDSATSFSATVFRDAGGNLTLAMRGTAELTGTPNDLQPTDTDIGLYGAGYDQIIAMCNWWARVSRPAGEPVAQFEIQSLPTGSPAPAGGVRIETSAPIQGNLTDRYVLSRASEATGELASHVSADADMRVEVTGHSLGGHLAMAFNALFPGEAGSVTAFNAPGFIDNTTNRNFFALMGGLLPSESNSANVTNVIADESGIGQQPWNAIAGRHSRPGADLNVSIENQWQTDETAPANGSWNHSHWVLTDSLAVYSLLAQLDPVLSTADYKTVLGTASAGTAASLERVADALESAFGFNNAALAPGNQIANRNALYEAINGLRSSPAFQASSTNSLVGKVTIAPVTSSSSPSIGSTAKTDFGEFIALRTLSPFALKPKAGDPDAAAALTGLWQTAHGTDYAAWQADRTARLTGDPNKDLDFSDSWYADRSAMLAWILKANEQNIDYTTNNGRITGQPVREPVRFQDLSSGTAFTVSLQALSQDALGVHRVVFGSDAAETINGADTGDQLYGGGGADIIFGDAGNDRIEGNAGIDDLNGGAGNDTLAGGEGSDQLRGGVGHDTLTGGQGNDTYEFQSGDGIDRIRDEAGQDIIRIDGVALSVGQRLDDNLWQSADGKARIVLDGQSLTINYGAGSVITVENYSAGQFGLDLQGTVRAVTVSASVQNGTPGFDFLGSGYYDFAAGRYVYTDLTGQAGDDELYVAVDRAALGGDGDDVIFSSGPISNDPHTPYASDNRIDGGNGNDTIVLGVGQDIAYGGAGSDLIDGAMEWDLSGARPAAQEPGNWPMGVRGGYRDYGPSAGAMKFVIDLDNGRIDYQYTPFFSNTVTYRVGAATWNVASTVAGNVRLQGNQDSVDSFSHPGSILPLGTATYTPQGNPPSTATFGLWNYTVNNDTARKEIFGGDGDDRLFGGAGNDLVSGGADSDVVMGNLGDDELFGDDGQDFLAGGDGADFLSGGNDGDFLFGELGADYVSAGDGDDVAYGDLDVEGRASDYAQHGNDVIDGGAGHDTLFGGFGDDQLVGGEGVDILVGDLTSSQDAGFRHGNDSLDGGSGDDTLFGGGGDDQLHGGDGDDDLYGDRQGGANAAVLFEGNDALYGGKGRDAMEGGGGNDLLDGGADADLLEGGSGDDVLDGGADADVLKGGAGNDTFVFGRNAGVDIARDFRADGSELDRLEMSDLLRGEVEIGQTTTGDLYVLSEATSAVLVVDNFFAGSNASNSAAEVVGLADATLTVQQVRDTVTPAIVDILATGSAGADSVTGSAAAELIASFGGDDKTFGLGGNDVLRGGAGNDWLFGGAGDDVLDGGAGNDMLNGSWSYGIFRPAGATEPEAGGGRDTYLFARGGGQDTIEDSVYQVNDLDKVKFKDLVATDLSFTRDLTTDDLVILVRNASDSLRVKGFFATTIDRSPIDVFEFADGSQWTPVQVRAELLKPTPGNDTLIGFGDDDVIDGGDGNDTISGRLGNDTLLGGNGSDTLLGNTGTDTLLGGDGDDVLYGHAGSDVLDGGPGNDFLDGVSFDQDNAIGGNDIYLFRRGGGQDTIAHSELFFYGGEREDTLRLTDLNPSDVEFVRETAPPHFTDDLVVRVRGSTDQVRLQAFFSADYSYEPDHTHITRIAFADGTVYALNDIVRATINPGSGDDFVHGYLTNDVIDGQAGNDQISGEYGDDTLFGGDGDDVLDGAEGNDTLDGGAGQDTLYGNDGADTIAGGDGADQLFGWYGNDMLKGGNDNDRLYGDDGDDVLEGDAGDDTLYGWTGDDRLSGGDGNDVLGGDDGNDHVTGDGGSDALFGWTGNDVVQGGAGWDYMDAGEGNDALTGGTEGDTLIGASGNDFLAGGTGDDSLRLGGGADVVVFNRGDGADTVLAPATGEGLGERNDTISLAGVRYSDLRLARSGNDLLIKVSETADSLRFEGWYTDSAMRTVAALQTIVDSTADYDANSSDALVNRRVVRLNFGTLVSAFDSAYSANPSIGDWAIPTATLNSARTASSDTDAIGGQLAYRYARDGNLTGLDFATASEVLSSDSFGTGAQSIGSGPTSGGIRLLQAAAPASGAFANVSDREFALRPPVVREELVFEAPFAPNEEDGEAGGVFARPALDGVNAFESALIETHGLRMRHTDPWLAANTRARLRAPELEALQPRVDAVVEVRDSAIDETAESSTGVASFWRVPLDRRAWAPRVPYLTAYYVEEALAAAPSHRSDGRWLEDLVLESGNGATDALDVGAVVEYTTQPNERTTEERWVARDRLLTTHLRVGGADPLGGEAPVTEVAFALPDLSAQAPALSRVRRDVNQEWRGMAP